MLELLDTILWWLITPLQIIQISFLLFMSVMYLFFKKRVLSVLSDVYKNKFNTEVPLNKLDSIAFNKVMTRCLILLILTVIKDGTVPLLKYLFY